MAHSISAKKRIRQNLKRRSRNRWRMQTLRTAIKAFEDKAQHAQYAEAETAFRNACRLLDKTASKGVIHKNQAAGESHDSAPTSNPKSKPNPHPPPAEKSPRAE